MIEFQPIDKVLREKKAAAFRQLKAAQGKASAVLGQLFTLASNLRAVPLDLL